MNLCALEADLTTFFTFLCQGSSQEQEENKEQHIIKQSISEHDLYRKACSCLFAELQ